MNAYMVNSLSSLYRFVIPTSLNLFGRAFESLAQLMLKVWVILPTNISVAKTLFDLARGELIVMFPIEI
jgi:hypothetical protein